MFKHHAHVSLADRDPLAQCLLALPLRKRTETLLAWARLGLAAHLFDTLDPPSTAEAWARLADRMAAVELHLARWTPGQEAALPEPSESERPDAAVVAEEHQELIANMMAAFHIPGHGKTNGFVLPDL
jgi:hypothetical protein